MSNKGVKMRLIQRYGKECFIDKLKLRPPEEKHYTGKAQMKKMKALTYHHIREKSKGGKTTVENGALLSAENHQWFNKQSKEAQDRMNKAFQDYKLSIDIAILAGGKIENPVEIPLEISEYITIPVEEGKRKYNRAKVKQETKKQIEEELEER